MALFIGENYHGIKSIYQNAEQSKFTSSHLCGLKLKESQCSIPSIGCRNSSHTNAAPKNIF